VSVGELIAEFADFFGLLGDAQTFRDSDAGHQCVTCVADKWWDRTAACEPEHQASVAHSVEAASMDAGWFDAFYLPSWPCRASRCARTVFRTDAECVRACSRVVGVRWST
jgi:hypothetical protein